MPLLVPSKENTAFLCFRSWNWLIPIIRLLYTSPWRNLNYFDRQSESNGPLFVCFGSLPINHYMCRFVYMGEGASYAVFGGWVMGTGSCSLSPVQSSDVLDVLIIECTWFTNCMIIDQCHKFVRHGIFLDSHIAWYAAIKLIKCFQYGCHICDIIPSVGLSMTPVLMPPSYVYLVSITSIYTLHSLMVYCVFLLLFYLPV